MSYFFGVKTQGTTGQVSYIIPEFNPTGFRFTVSQLEAGSENNIAHFSTGMTDGTTSRSHAVLATNVGTTITRKSNTYCLAHYAIVNNTTTRVISATVVSIVGNIITLNFDRASADYEISIEAFA